MNKKIVIQKNYFHEYLLFISHYFLDEDVTNNLNKVYTNSDLIAPKFYNYIDALDQQNLEQRHGNLLLNNC